MNAKETKEEFRPCPFCGKSNHEMTLDKRYLWLSCDKYSEFIEPIPLDLNENAYCWKLLDEKDQQIKALVEALEKINENCHGDSVVYSRVALSQFREAIKQEKI